MSWRGGRRASGPERTVRFLAQWLVGVLALTAIGFTVPQSASAAPRVSPWPAPTIVSTSPLSGAALVTWMVDPAPGGVPLTQMRVYVNGASTPSQLVGYNGEPPPQSPLLVTGLTNDVPSSIVLEAVYGNRDTQMSNRSVSPLMSDRSASHKMNVRSVSPATVTPRSSPCGAYPGTSLPTDFIACWDTTLISTGSSDDSTVSLPLIRPSDPRSYSAYNFTVNWGDGTSGAVDAWNDPDATHTYGTPGRKWIKISGTFTGFSFAAARTYGTFNDRLKLIDVAQWGNMSLGNFQIFDAPPPTPFLDRGGYFEGAANLNFSADDTPGLTPHTTVLDFAFAGATSFNSPLNNWDVSSVVSMQGTFGNASSFNQPLDNWNTSFVRDMGDMFTGASAFNGSIGPWNVSNVANMTSMFASARAFNQDIRGWVVSNVTTMYQMFGTATAFNQPIGAWNTSNVTDMANMFLDAINFDQDLSGWNTSNVRTMSSMFYRASSFDNGGVDLQWDDSVGKVSNFSSMFEGATSFDQPIGEWRIGTDPSVTSISMAGMFQGALSFDRRLNSWDVSKVTNMNAMFNATALSTVNYDAMLNGWASQTVQPNVPLGASTTAYSSAARSSRNDTLVTLRGWSVSDLGLVAGDADDTVFPDTFVGVPSAPLAVTVTNTGGVTVAIDDTGAALTGGDASSFQVDAAGCANQLLAVSASCSVQVTFNPTSAGPKTANVVFTSDNPANRFPGPIIGVVTGTGLAPAAARVPTFDTPVSTSDGFTVNVTNWDNSWTWTPTVTPGTVTAGTASGTTLPLTVTGLAAGQAATVTVTTIRAGYATGTGTVSGQATSNPQPPRPPRPTPTPRPTPPAPVPAPALKPGEVALNIDGQPQSVNAQPRPNDRGLELTGEGFSVTMTGLDAKGQPLALSPNGALVLQQDQPVQTSGNGYQANAPLGLYLNPLTSARSASRVQATTPTVLGTITSSASGTFAASIDLPPGVTVGDHVLQVVGLTPSGAVRALSLGIRVGPQASITLVKGKRVHVRGRIDTVTASGTTDGISGGEKLTPYVRFGSRGPFIKGAVTVKVDPDGSFTYTRKVRAHRPLEMYLTWNDARSNSVSWQRIK